MPKIKRPAEVQWRATPIAPRTGLTFRGSLAQVAASVRDLGRSEIPNYEFDRISKFAEPRAPVDQHGRALRRYRIYMVRVPGCNATRGYVEPHPETDEMFAILKSYKAPVLVVDLDPSTTWERIA